MQDSIIGVDGLKGCTYSDSYTINENYNAYVCYHNPNTNEQAWLDVNEYGYQWRRHKQQATPMDIGLARFCLHLLKQHHFGDDVVLSILQESVYTLE